MSVPRKWWSNKPTGWSAVKDATVARSKGSVTLDPAVALVAMEFGYGAREAYPSESSWASIAEKVKEDWELSGNDLEHPWASVFGSVKLGWVAAEPTIVSPTHPKGETEPPETLAERREPGEKVPMVPMPAKAPTEPGDALASKPDAPMTATDGKVELVPGSRPRL